MRHLDQLGLYVGEQSRQTMRLQDGMFNIRYSEKRTTMMYKCNYERLVREQILRSLAILATRTTAVHLLLAPIHVHMLMALSNHRARVRWLHDLHRLHRLYRHTHLRMLQRALEIHSHQNALQCGDRWRRILELTSIISDALK